MFLKKRTDAQSYSKSCILSEGTSFWRIFTIPSASAPLMFSASSITSSFNFKIQVRFLPAETIFPAYPSIISLQMSSILKLDFLVISSMKSLMESLALQDRMFWICLLFTNRRLWILINSVLSSAGATKTLSLSSLEGDLNRNTLSLASKNLMNFLSSSSNRQFLSPFISIIFSISRMQLAWGCSLSALLMMRNTPSLMSSNVLKAFWRDFTSLGNLSALVSLMWVSSITKTSFTFLQMSSSLWMKKELEISYYSPLLSLNPGQSQKAIFSITILVGTEVSENFWCPILMSPPSLLSKLGLSPSNLTVNWAPLKNDMIVLFPTPVSPIISTADSLVVSTGIASIPFLIISFNLPRSMGALSIKYQNIRNRVLETFKQEF